MPADASPGGPTAERDWTDTVTDRIESTVSKLADRTTVPATLVARGIVYGLIVGVLGAALLLLLLIAGIRVLDVYLPFHPVGRRVWVVDAALGGLFVVAGAFIWRMRRPRSA